MRVAIYARVSTEEQETSNQLDALKEFAKHRGYDIAQVYQESESAWKEGHQAELAKMLEDARKGKFEIVIVWALDRLTRAGSSAILQMVDRLKKYKVRVISLQEGWTEAPGDMSDVLYAITGWVAQQESKRRSARTKAGLARAQRDGNGRRGPDRVRRVRRYFRRPKT